MNKPSKEQVAWVFKHLCDAMKEPGTFRYLIYNRMGFPKESYSDLYHAGGMTLTNTFADLGETRDRFENMRTLIKKIISERGRTCNEPNHKCATNEMLQDLIPASYEE